MPPATPTWSSAFGKVNYAKTKEDLDAALEALPVVLAKLAGQLEGVVDGTLPDGVQAKVGAAGLGCARVGGGVAVARPKGKLVKPLRARGGRALVASGALDFEEAVRLVHARGRFIQEAVAEGRGAMAAVLGLAPGDVERVCESARAATGGAVSPANYNAPEQTVIAGDAAAVDLALPRSRPSRESSIEAG